MNMAALLLILQVALLLAMTWTYFSRYQMERPPLGVMNGGDLLFIMLCIILLPNLYVLLPSWVLVALLVLGGLQLLLLVSEPLVRRRLLRWCLVLTLLGLDIWATFALGFPSTQLMLINNILVLLLAMGVAVLWVQSGMQARHVTLLGAFLIGYDYLATVRSTLMDDMLTRMMALPLGPVLLAPDGAGGWAGLGLGDLLLAAVFPIALWKAFGRRAGMAANLLTLLALAGLNLLLVVLQARATFPVMVVLGPLMIVQYAFWRRRCGAERTTQRFVAEDAPPRRYSQEAPA